MPVVNLMFWQFKFWLIEIHRCADCFGNLWKKNRKLFTKHLIFFFTQVKLKWGSIMEKLSRKKIPVIQLLSILFINSSFWIVFTWRRQTLIIGVQYGFCSSYYNYSENLSNFNPFNNSFLNSPLFLHFRHGWIIDAQKIATLQTKLLVLATRCLATKVQRTL